MLNPILKKGKHYILHLHETSDKHSPLHVRSVIYAMYHSVKGHVYCLNTDEYAKDIELLESEIKTIIEVGNEMDLYPHDLSFDELVDEMFILIQRQEKKLGEPINIGNFIMSVKYRLMEWYKVKDMDMVRKVGYEAYNRKYPHNQYKYKPLNNKY